MLAGASRIAVATTTVEITVALAEQLARAASAPGETAAALNSVYAEAGFAPLWVDDAGLTAKGQALRRVLDDAAAEGLAPEDYEVGAIGALDGLNEATNLARLEILLSRSLLRYASDLRYGRIDPSEHEPELFVPPRDGDPQTIIAEAQEAKDIAAFLAAFAPQAPEYGRLREALARYREIARSGSWRLLPDGETLKPGMADARVPLLRERLMQLGDLPPDSAGGELYGDALQAAVKRFQYRHGLEQDAAVGQKTTAALNVPIERRIEQMILNLERRRWMVGERGDFYVFVNMADFELKVVEGNRTIFDTRVVVGTAYNQTPVFNGTMTYIEINPFWNIPPSIARKEMLPKIGEDVSYLTRQKIRVFSSWGEDAEELDPLAINWSSVSSSRFPYKLRQDPGEANALGRIKFMFPNRFNVYLHDTPSRSLFQRTVRNFSHGCIRVQHPLNLAEVLLRANPGWTPDRFEKEVASGQRRVVTLKRPVPVYLTYITAWVNKDGGVHFRDDIYDRDRKLAEALRLSHMTMAQ